MSTFSDVQWTAGQRIENVNGVEGLAATGSVDSDNLYLVFRKKDNTVWYTTATGTGAVWNTPNQIEGVSARSAPALTMTSTTLHMAYAGTDGKIYDCVQGTNGGWTSTAIPGAKGDNVGSTTVGGVLHLVFTGESGKYLWFTSYQATGWTKPVPIKDHDATYSPALAGDSSTNTLYMVHVGKGGSKLYFSQYTP
jgi:hypothetical protein